jgi:hypothetical protein
LDVDVLLILVATVETTVILDEVIVVEILVAVIDDAEEIVDVAIDAWVETVVSAVVPK